MTGRYAVIGCKLKQNAIMRAATVVQQVCKSCRTCFKFYCMFYFTCYRSFSTAYKADSNSLHTPRLPGTKSTHRPLPHKCETHITSVYPVRHRLTTKTDCGDVMHDTGSNVAPYIGIENWRDQTADCSTMEGRLKVKVKAE